MRDSEVKSVYIEPTQTKWLSKQVHRKYRCVRVEETHPTPKLLTMHTLERNIKEFLYFLSTHVIYRFICHCGLRYVGQTERSLKLLSIGQP